MRLTRTCRVAQRATATVISPPAEPAAGLAAKVQAAAPESAAAVWAAMECLASMLSV
jgi:hypothetical protein